MKKIIFVLCIILNIGCSSIDREYIESKIARSNKDRIRHLYKDYNITETKDTISIDIGNIVTIYTYTNDRLNTEGTVFFCEVCDSIFDKLLINTVDELGSPDKIYYDGESLIYLFNSYNTIIAKEKDACIYLFSSSGFNKGEKK